MKKLVMVLALFLALISGCAIYPWTVPTITVFEVNPSVVTSGGSSLLVWNVVGATSASIDQGIGSIPLAGTRTISPTNTTTYTLTAANSSTIVTKSVTLIVNPPPVPAIAATFTVAPNVITQGDSALLQWNVSGATLISIDQGIGSVPASGSLSVSPGVTTTYTLTATNSANSVIKSVVLTVNPPPIIATLSINPSQITPGQYATISWNVSGATSIRIDPDIGNVPATGSQAVNPTTTTTYVLTATSSCCAVNKTVVLIVNTPTPPPSLPIVQIFSVNPATIHVGGTAVLQWNIINADTVTITSIGSVPLIGSILISPPVTTVYTLTASKRLWHTCIFSRNCSYSLRKDRNEKNYFCHFCMPFDYSTSRMH